MKIKDYKCKCGHNDFFFADKGSQKGIYCSYCGKWLKWADKNEQNLAMKQEPILDKIRTEIETKYGQGSICEYDSDYGLGWYQVGDIADILQIIDKYKAESEVEDGND